MDMAESNQTLLLMVLEYGDQVLSMISSCFLFFVLFLFVCLFVKLIGSISADLSGPNLFLSDKRHFVFSEEEHGLTS